MMEMRQNITTPDVPWAMSLFEPVTGALNRTILQEMAERRAAASSVYVVTGNVTIPGNAGIRPYDRWGAYVIKSVSHNIDLQNKSWTTSMELIKATNA
jgi:hypothetical protein